jgi:hypothetical protein
MCPPDEAGAPDAAEDDRPEHDAQGPPQDREMARVEAEAVARQPGAPSDESDDSDDRT